MSKKIRITFEDSFYREAHEAAKAKGPITVQALIRLAVREYINRYCKSKGRS